MKRRALLILFCLLALLLCACGAAAVEEDAYSLAPLEASRHVPQAERALPDAEAAPEITYILNISSHKFHRPECAGVASMKEENKRAFTGTRDEAIAVGYSPCGTCKP